MYKITTFAKLIGVSRSTLLNWEKQGILIPAIKAPTGHRYYSEIQLQAILNSGIFNKNTAKKDDHN
jgi:DNA-binding transcriptional MerR regulator